MRWLAVVAWMGVIFLFSAQAGGESAGLSNVVVDLLAPVITIEPETISLLVRKAAHLGEYAILGALLAWAWRAKGIRQVFWPIVTGILYAVSDEVHQVFVPDRAGRVTDVLIDSVGVAIGVVLVVLAVSRGYIGRYVRHDGEGHGRRRPVRQEQRP